MNSLQSVMFHFAVVFLSTASVPSAAQTLTPSEIAALEARLEKARGVDAALNTRAQCYDAKEASLQESSDQLQEAAGDLHRQEQELAPELKRTRLEFDSFSKEFRNASIEMRNLAMKEGEVNHEIRKRQAAIDDCKSRFGLGLLCDFAAELSGLKSDLRSLEGRKKETSIRIASIENRLDASRREMSQAERQYREVTQAHEKNKGEIASVEERIGIIKSSLSEIRTVKQGNANLRSETVALLKEFRRLAPGSERQSVARRLRSESEELDALLVKAQKLLDDDGLKLPGGERICAG